MHDPDTLGFSIYGPRGLYELWKRRRTNDPRCYYRRRAIIAVWHHDPVEDACGWTNPQFYPTGLEKINKEAAFEFKYMFW